jgi:hypothetical protein
VVLRVPVQVFISCAPDLVFGVPRAPGPVFIFWAPRIVWCGTDSVGFRFHVLRSPTRFGLYRGRRVHFSCFALPDSFGAIPSAPGLIVMFCVPPTCFGHYRGLQVHFSCFALPYSFGVITRAPGPVLMFCGPSTLRSRTRLGRYRGRRVQCSCFVLPELGVIKIMYIYFAQNCVKFWGQKC